MKKKIINGIMMVALVAAASTSFVSCKDTNEDVRIEQAAEIAALQGRLSELEELYGDLDGRVTALRNDVIALQNDMSLTQANVDKLGLRCDQLESWLKDTFAKLVTSVEINGTWNNMTGMLAPIPGVKSNILIANYGEAGNDGEFPVEGKMVDEENEKIKWVAAQKFGYDDLYATYAGTIYATVNKYINGDFELDEDKFGADLVTTSGKACDLVTIALGNDGKPTEKDLTWGWTRADNNVYEFEIGVKANPEDLGFKLLKVEGLKDDIKTILKNRQNTTAQEFAQAAAKLYYSAIQGGFGSNLPMYALRLGWTTGKNVDDQNFEYDVYDGATNTSTKKELTWTQPDFMKEAKHFVQSDADLMLTTIKPLAFTTKDVPTTVTPKVQMTLDQAEKIFNRMMASVNSIVSRAVAAYKGVATGKSESDYSLQDMMVSLISDEANKHRFVGGGGNGPVATGDATAADAGTLWYAYDDNAYWYVADGGVDVDLNTYFVEYLSTQAKAVNRAIELVEEAQIYATNGSLFQNKFADKVLNYSAKVDKWLGENFNHALQPTLFAIHSAKEGNKILQTIETVDAKLNRVSGVKGAPLKVSSKSPVILKPTSYTVETFCPIMAKFVTISEIDGKAIEASEAEAKSIVSENGRTAKFGHVISSYYDQYIFQPEAGKTYTILYEAVDFFGNTFKKEYYIKGE